MTAIVPSLTPPSYIFPSRNEGVRQRKMYVYSEKTGRLSHHIWLTVEENSFPEDPAVYPLCLIGQNRRVRMSTPKPISGRGGYMVIIDLYRL